MHLNTMHLSLKGRKSAGAVMKNKKCLKRVLEIKKQKITDEGKKKTFKKFLLSWVWFNLTQVSEEPVK